MDSGLLNLVDYWKIRHHFKLHEFGRRLLLLYMLKITSNVHTNLRYFFKLSKALRNKYKIKVIFRESWLRGAILLQHIETSVCIETTSNQKYTTLFNTESNEQSVIDDLFQDRLTMSQIIGGL